MGGRLRLTRTRGARSLPSYGKDLAYVHHVGFTDFARGAAPGVLALLRAARLTTGLVVDLGCGSGVWARELLGAGYSVLGVDSSASMVALARETAPAATFRRGSVHELPIPPCAAVTSLGEVLGYLPDESPTRESLAPLFRRVAASLAPGGLFVFDLMIRGGAHPMGYRTWTRGDGWSVEAEVREDTRRALLTRDITTFRRVGRLYRRSDERHAVRLFARAEVERWLRASGFTVRVTRRYGSFPLAPRRLAFIARKPR